MISVVMVATTATMATPSDSARVLGPLGTVRVLISKPYHLGTVPERACYPGANRRAGRISWEITDWAGTSEAMISSRYRQDGYHA